MCVCVRERESVEGVITEEDEGPAGGREHVVDVVLHLSCGLGGWVLDSGFGAQSFGFRVWVQCLELSGVQCLGFRVWGSAFRV